MAGPSLSSNPLPLFLNSFSFSRLSSLQSSQRGGGDGSLRRVTAPSCTQARCGRERKNSKPAEQQRGAPLRAVAAPQAAAAARGSRVFCAPEARARSSRGARRVREVELKIVRRKFQTSFQRPPRPATPNTLLPQLARAAASLRPPDFSPCPELGPSLSGGRSSSGRSRVQKQQAPPFPPRSRGLAKARMAEETRGLWVRLHGISVFVFEHRHFLRLQEGVT